jgi:hypothetical protein
MIMSSKIEGESEKIDNMKVIISSIHSMNDHDSYVSCQDINTLSWFLKDEDPRKSDLTQNDVSLMTKKVKKIKKLKPTGDAKDIELFPKSIKDISKWIKAYNCKKLKDKIAIFFKGLTLQKSPR